MILRDYQQNLKEQIYEAWQSGFKNVLLVKATGLGKTKTFCSVAMDKAVSKAPMRAAIGITANESWPTAILVHRKELVQQISLTLAEEGIVHNIIAPRNVIKGIVAAQRKVYHKQFYDYNASITVISVDTLNARIKHHESWAASIKLWITDEATHLLRDNKWGKAVAYFPNALGLGVTATPERLDKRGLGRHADGVFDIIIEGPSTRWGIENGYLCNYKIALPISNYEHHLKKASDGSDFSKESMQLAALESSIVGDVVENYLKFAKGKQAIIFSSDIGSGARTEREFTEKGVIAKLLTGDTDDSIRLQSLLDFREKKINVLLNVDLFDEGLDVVGIEVVTQARPTMSVSKYLQMNGRGLRPVYAKGYDLSTKEGRLEAIASGPKPFCLIIDHVGNVSRHGLPDGRRKWTLDRIIRRKRTVNLMRICEIPTCNLPYDRILLACPYCGHEFGKGTRESGGGGGRPGPFEVDGDLHLLDPETLRMLEGNTHLEDPAEVARRVGAKAGPDAATRAMRAQRERIDTQKKLAEVIATWAGRRRRENLSDRMINKLFYLTYGQTITEALSEPSADMIRTMSELQEDR